MAKYLVVPVSIGGNSKTWVDRESAAIIAGRIRHETRNFRLLSHFVGTGTLRKQFLKTESDG